MTNQPEKSDSCKARAIARKEGEQFSAVLTIDGKRFVLKDAVHVAKDPSGSYYAIGATVNAFFSAKGAVLPKGAHRSLEIMKWTNFTPVYTEAERAAMQARDHTNTYLLEDGKIVIVKRPFKEKVKKAKKVVAVKPEPVAPVAQAPATNSQTAPAATHAQAVKAPVATTQHQTPQTAAAMATKIPVFQSLGRAIIKGK